MCVIIFVIVLKDRIYTQMCSRLISSTMLYSILSYDVNNYQNPAITKIMISIRRNHRKKTNSFPHFNRKIPTAEKVPLHTFVFVTKI